MSPRRGFNLSNSLKVTIISAILALLSCILFPIDLNFLEVKNLIPSNYLNHDPNLSSRVLLPPRGQRFGNKKTCDLATSPRGAT
jgi:hypothetical protein